jgi:hypothetical protein
VRQALGSQPWVPIDARTAGEMSSQLLGRPSKQDQRGASRWAIESHLLEEALALSVPVPPSVSTSSPAMILAAMEALR